MFIDVVVTLCRMYFRTISSKIYLLSMAFGISAGLAALAIYNASAAAEYSHCVRYLAVVSVVYAMIFATSLVCLIWKRSDLDVDRVVDVIAFVVALFSIAAVLAMCVPIIISWRTVDNFNNKSATAGMILHYGGAAYVAADNPYVAADSGVYCYCHWIDCLIFMDRRFVCMLVGQFDVNTSYIVQPTNETFNGAYNSGSGCVLCVVYAPLSTATPKILISIWSIAVILMIGIGYAAKRMVN